MSQVLDKKLHAGIDKLNEKQKKAVYDIIQAFAAEEMDHAPWNDEHFIAEMDRRQDNYKNGGKMISAEEASKLTRDLINKRKGV